MPAQVAVIIVNWHGANDTLECLGSLALDTDPARRVYVVDNGSADDSVARVRSAFPEVTVIETGANLGFTGGNNVGIRQALEDGADYLFLLNNDTVVEPTAISDLVAAADAHPEYGILTPVIHYYDEPDEAWFAGSTIDLSRGVAVHDNSHVPARSDPPSAIPWASGCAMLIPADVARKTGGFDDRFFLIWEDVDLCLRVREAGWRIGIVPAARIRHKVSRSFDAASGVGSYYHLRNHLLLLRTHGSGAYGPTALRVMLRSVRTSARAIIRRHSGGIGLPCDAARAVFDHMRRRYGPMNSTKDGRRAGTGRRALL